MKLTRFARCSGEGLAVGASQLDLDVGEHGAGLVGDRAGHSHAGLSLPQRGESAEHDEGGYEEELSHASGVYSAFACLAVIRDSTPSSKGVMIRSCRARITRSQSGSNFFQPVA